MIIEAIGWMAVVWVINSFARMILPYKPKLEKYMCQKCWTMWITLACTMDPFTAATAALMAALIDMHLNNTEIKL